MKIKMKLRQLFILTIFVILIFTCYKLYLFLRPVKVVYYKNTLYEFRDNIKAADKVSVYPDEDTIHNLFWDTKIKNTSIVFKPMDPRTNGYYSVEAFELTYKLSSIYNLENFKRNFNAQQIESYEDITSEETVLKIILVPPSLSEKTYVKAEDNKIYIYGEDFRGLDLATIKTILVAMGIEI